MLMNCLILLIAIVFASLIAIVMGILTKKMNWDRETSSSFECGFNTKDQGLLPFSFRFYLLANIFLVFDVELILLFPFLTKFMIQISWFNYLIFLGLILILSLGLFYEWNQKMLEWVV